MSLRVVEAVARSRGVDPSTLPELQTVIDPDALDVLFGPRTNGVPRRCEDGEVRFSYAERLVVVDSEGRVDVREPIDERSSTERG